MKRFLTLCAAGVLLTACTQKELSSTEPEPMPNIIPEPASMVTGSGKFMIDSETSILISSADPEVARVAAMLKEKITNAGGPNLSINQAHEPSENSIYFNLTEGNEQLGDEGYQLNIEEGLVTVEATKPAGLFYGLQTIYQLLPPEVEQENENIDLTMPVVSILDTPRFEWRGMHLDVVRHFMPLDFVKKYIDNLAYHKLNTFHWHLTDDQGWRIEIKKYPLLTEVGAKRKESLIGHALKKPYTYDGEPHGGFYTQEEIKDIIKYAQDRFVTIVPEIEMPGHATAAIAAYPFLGVSGEPIDVSTRWGILPDIFNADDTTFAFLENVLAEVIGLFPSEYIHIGGDEAIKNQWEASPKIQQQIKDLGLANEQELQSYFITRIEKFVNSKGRKIIGWDEILEGGLAPNAAVMSWRGEKGGIAAAKAGHYVVMSPSSHLYFDHYQGDPEKEPLAIGGSSTIEKVYNYDPIPEVLSPDEAKYIMGAQANLWTEYIETPEHVEYMVYPRIAALAEVVWSPKEKKDWNKFKEKLPVMQKRYEYRGINSREYKPKE